MDFTQIAYYGLVVLVVYYMLRIVSYCFPYVLVGSIFLGAAFVIGADEDLRESFIEFMKEYAKKESNSDPKEERRDNLLHTAE
jgi:hypothetical protein